MNNIPSEVEQACRRKLGDAVNLNGFSTISGGCINNGGRLKTSSGDFFLKWNDAKKYPSMFAAEAKGLRILKQYSSIHIPDVIGWFEESSYQGIVLEFIDSKAKSNSYWSDLGSQLAMLHKNSNEHFGLDHSNYIGSLRQFNKASSSWTTFFIEQRLDVQVKLAIDSGHFDRSILKLFENLYKQLPSIFPDEKPALLHGDLWSGNVITTETGKPCLIDPAVYFGHREAELSFTQLFGGFVDEFYNAYGKTFPLAAGFDQRVDIYNLYPLLVHVNLFGGGYIHQVKSILKQFG
jgi:protein-ribulosamine 3-kinase